ncbi:MAG: translation initiation factor IF-2 [Alphaproteobacteria bacterium]|nr:translation initiation factor IF-2 [Alphaproteobacteria bacterium]
MTEETNINDKPKKLTLTTNTLTLSKSVDSTTLRKTYISSKVNTVAVEVKRTQPGGSSLLTRKLTSSTTPTYVATTSSEDGVVNSKLNLLRRAAEDAKQREEEQQRRSLTIAKVAADINAKELESKESAATTSIQTTTSEEDAVAKNAKFFKPCHKKIETQSEEPISTKDQEKVVIKSKWSEPKKLRKNDIFGMIGQDEDGDNIRSKTRSLASIKRAREKERRKQENKQDKVYREVTIPEIISVGELANRMSERVADVIKELMKLGLIANANQNIDADTAEIIVNTMGHKFKRVQDSDVENWMIQESDAEEDKIPCAPVVTVMGHVDHGKTSLLDALKSTDIASREAGGITQHIGAYRVNLASGKAITFIDTPGHEAFTEMRSRGAKVTNIVVLVLAADDGIMTQTIEAINHAKAANVPIIVAVNKIDKPDANLEKVKNELLSNNLVPEEYGGDVIVIPVSATKNINLDKLEEAILLVAEMADLRANPKASASGAVIESRVDRAKGVIATLLVTRGTLKKGDLLVAGSCYGKVKKMVNDKGDEIAECAPSMPAEVWGLDFAPLAGESFAVVNTEKQARDITEYRIKKSLHKKSDQIHKTSLDEMFLKATGEGSVKELAIIIKADVQGSLEAITSSLNKIVSKEVRIRIIHSGVGGITESDVSLAVASNAMILGFNVRAPSAVQVASERNGVGIKYYSIIYNLFDDVKSMVVDMLPPIIREVYIGSVSIRQVFNITKVGKVAGSYVTKGVVKRGAGVRLIRDNIVIYEGKLKTLKRFKDEVKEVKENYECGIAFENYEDIREGDTVEAYQIVEEKRTL